MRSRSKRQRRCFYFQVHVLAVPPPPYSSYKGALADQSPTIGGYRIDLRLGREWTT